MNKDYILVADADCEIPLSWADEYDIVILPMPVTVNGVEYKYDLGKEVKLEDFFQKMREGAVPTTAQANPEDFKALFTPHLEQGKDILYLGVSSGLSGTVGCAHTAAVELMEQFPDRKIVAIDTLAISVAMGIIVREAGKLRKEGKSMQEVIDFVEANKLRACAVFTVDDLVYLKRGGRVSGAAAFFGKLMEVKPILHISPEGKLVPLMKVKGRKNAIKKIAQIVADYAENIEEQSICLLHAESEDDMKQFDGRVRELCKPKEIVTMNVGPVIGAHSGPGTLATGFFAKDRTVKTD